MDKYDSISPLDFRYYGGNPDVYSRLHPYLSERAFVVHQLKVESALAQALAAHGVCGQDAADEISRACTQVTPEEVYAEDARIKHATRALVNCIRAKVGDAAKPYVHFTTTSFDITDSANALRYKECVLRVLVPDLLALQRTLIALAIRERATVQIGRTHGQHAVPVTFGYAIAGYVDRIGNVAVHLERAAQQLRGKVSGAVGSHNAQRLFFEDPQAFERDVLTRLGLSPSRHATQVVQPEWLLDVLHFAVEAHGILANLADDMRHLQRTEIGEVAEEFGKDQVGSSTMPHKRNPWNFENVKSMWKEALPRVLTHYMDQICEHQRDLTNSASARFIPEILALLDESVLRMDKIMGKIIVVRERIVANLAMNKEMVNAEAAYLILASLGHPDAHECIRQKTLESQLSGVPLRTLLFGDPVLEEYMGKLTAHQRDVLEHPERYVGVCERKTQEICDHWLAMQEGTR